MIDDGILRRFEMLRRCTLSSPVFEEVNQQSLLDVSSI